MREFRKSKDCTEHYTSLEELRAAWGKQPVKKRTDNAEKLQAQREKFLGTCPACKNILSYIYGSSYKVCKNEDCRGVKKTGKDEEGNEKIYYVPYISKPLDEHGKEIAMVLFDE